MRLLLGDPAGPQLAARDREHSISGGVAGRAAAVPGYYRQMPEAVELRLHDTPLYNSVYRLDDEMLVTGSRPVAVRTRDDHPAGAHR